MWPILASRGTSVTLFGLAAVGLGARSACRGCSCSPSSCGMVDMSANALYLLAARDRAAQRRGDADLALPASTVLLARVVLGERLNARQVAGVGCALAAIVLIVSGGRL